MRQLFVLLVLVCISWTRTTPHRNQDVMRKMKRLHPLRLKFSESFSTRRLGHTTPEDDIRCYEVLFSATCSSSYPQKLINAIAKCGDMATYAIDVMVDDCAHDKNGDYCGILFLRDSLNSCSGSSCSAACFNSLKQAGCCLNLTDSYSQYLRLCNLPTPSICNNSGLIIPNTTHDPTCNSPDDYTVTTFKAVCDNVQPVIGVLIKNSCTDMAQGLTDECSSRNGHYCYMELNMSGSDSVGIQSLKKAGQNCPSASSCPSECRNSLTDVVNTIGCCFHAAYAILFYDYEYDTIFNSTLWATCGLPIPPHCSSTFTKAINTLL